MKEKTKYLLSLIWSTLMVLLFVYEAITNLFLEEPTARHIIIGMIFAVAIPFGIRDLIIKSKRNTSE